MAPGLTKDFSSVSIDVVKTETSRSDHDSENLNGGQATSASLRIEPQNWRARIDALRSVLPAAEDTTLASDQATVEASCFSMRYKGATTPKTATKDSQHGVRLEGIHWSTITALDTPPDQIMLDSQRQGKYLCLEPYRSWADTL